MVTKAASSAAKKSKGQTVTLPRVEYGAVSVGDGVKVPGHSRNFQPFSWLEIFVQLCGGEAGLRFGVCFLDSWRHLNVDILIGNLAIDVDAWCTIGVPSEVKP